MSTTLLIGNALLALLSGGSSLVALARPGVILPAAAPVSPLARFYAGAYTARAVPLSVVALAAFALAGPEALLPLLVVLGAAQVGDAALGVRLRNWGMTAGASVGAVIHLLSAAWLAAH
jgi:hypothetical protein